MSYVKINLTTFEIVENPSQFPRPGMLKSRSAQDRAAIHDDPGGFLGASREVDTLVRYDDVTTPDGTVTGKTPIYEKAMADPCPAGLRGFGWWPVVDQTPPLGFMDSHGAVAFTVDKANRRVIQAAPVIAPSAEVLADGFNQIERDLHRVIDAAAEQRRLDFITAGDGQAATYSVKLAEAVAIAAGATPSAAAHPFVWKEAAALGKSAADRAAEIVATSQAWFAIGSDIEAARQGAKVAVGAAKGDRTAMETAAAVDWAAIGGV